MRMGIIYGIILLVSVQFILEFRREGLANYVKRTVFQEQYYQQPERDRAGLVIDNNLLSLARTVDYFPKRADYLGFEVPYWALVKPIPRAFWPGKPKGLSISIETVRNERGAEAATWASTFLGESYMGGGLFGVGLAALT